MIKPVNSHVLIEPVAYDSFIASQKETFQEIGVVVDLDANALALGDGKGGLALPVYVGDKVYFDAWLAKKYPKEDGTGFYWLVKWDDITAVEHAERKSV